MAHDSVGSPDDPPLGKLLSFDVEREWPYQRGPRTVGFRTTGRPGIHPQPTGGVSDKSLQAPPAPLNPRVIAGATPENQTYVNSRQFLDEPDADIMVYVGR